MIAINFWSNMSCFNIFILPITKMYWCLELGIEDRISYGKTPVVLQYSVELLLFLSLDYPFPSSVG